MQTHMYTHTLHTHAIHTNVHTLCTEIFDSEKSIPDFILVLMHRCMTAQTCRDR